MIKFLKNVWNDDAGFIVSSEMLFLYTITVLGLVVGMTNVQRAVVSELTDVASSLLALDQSYGTVSIVSTTGGGNGTNSSSFADNTPTDSSLLGTTVLGVPTATTPGTVLADANTP